MSLRERRQAEETHELISSRFAALLLHPVHDALVHVDHSSRGHALAKVGAPGNKKQRVTEPDLGCTEPMPSEDSPLSALNKAAKELPQHVEVPTGNSDEIDLETGAVYWTADKDDPHKFNKTNDEKTRDYFVKMESVFKLDVEELKKAIKKSTDYKGYVNKKIVLIKVDGRLKALKLTSISGAHNFVFNVNAGQQEWMRAWMSYIGVKNTDVAVAVRMQRKPAESNLKEVQYEALLALNASKKGYGPKVYAVFRLEGVGVIYFMQFADYGNVSDYITNHCYLIDRKFNLGESLKDVVSRASQDGLLMLDIKDINILVASKYPNGIEVMVSDFDAYLTKRFHLQTSSRIIDANCIEIMNTALLLSQLICFQNDHEDIIRSLQQSLKLLIEQQDCENGMWKEITSLESSHGNIRDKDVVNAVDTLFTDEENKIDIEEIANRFIFMLWNYSNFDHCWGRFIKIVGNNVYSLLEDTPSDFTKRPTFLWVVDNVLLKGVGASSSAGAGPSTEPAVPAQEQAALQAGNAPLRPTGKCERRGNASNFCMTPSQ